MSVDTRGYVPGVNFSNFVKTVSKLFPQGFEEEDGVHWSHHIINFDFWGEERRMNCHEVTIDREADRIQWDSDNTDSQSYYDQGLPDKTSGIYFNVSHWGSAELIIKTIVLFFGGYYNREDGTTQDFVKLKKNHRAIVEDVFK